MCTYKHQMPMQCCCLDLKCLSVKQQQQQKTYTNRVYTNPHNVKRPPPTVYPPSKKSSQQKILVLFNGILACVV